MRLGHEEHSSHQVRGRDALRALAFAVTALALHLFISVFPVYRQGDVIWKTQTAITSVQAGASRAETTQDSVGIKPATLRQLTSVHTEVTVVLVQGLQGGDVRRPFHYLIHPLDGAHHFVTLFLSEDRRSFMFGNLSWKRRTSFLIINSTDSTKALLIRREPI